MDVQGVRPLISNDRQVQCLFVGCGSHCIDKLLGAAHSLLVYLLDEIAPAQAGVKGVGRLGHFGREYAHGIRRNA